MIAVKVCDCIWSMLDQKAVLDYGIETGSVLAWTVGCQLIRMLLAFLRLSPYMPLTLLYTCPPLMHLYLTRMGWAKSVLPNLPIRIAEVLLGRRGSLLVLIPAHITGCILGITMIRMFFSIFFEEFTYVNNEGGATRSGVPLPFFIEQSFMPTIYTTVNQFTLTPFRLLSTFLMEIWNTALYVVLFLALPALLKVNRFKRWYTYLFLIPLLMTWDTDFLSNNFVTNSDSFHLKGKDSFPTDYGLWLQKTYQNQDYFTSRIIKSFVQEKTVPEAGKNDNKGIQENEKVKYSVITDDNSCDSTIGTTTIAEEENRKIKENEDNLEKKSLPKEDLSSSVTLNRDLSVIHENIETILASLYSSGPLLYAPILWGLYYTYPKEYLDQIYEHIVEPAPSEVFQQNDNLQNQHKNTNSKGNENNKCAAAESCDQNLDSHENKVRDGGKKKKGIRTLLETKNNKWLGFFGYRYGYKYANVPLIIYLRSFGSILGGVLAGYIMNYMFPDSD